MDCHLLPPILSALWLGFILAISFMESWLKFRAKGVTLEIGLSIGSLVFRALNRVEWALLVLLGISLSLCATVSKVAFYIFPTLAVILLLQTFVLLPVLSKRARQLISGARPQKSPVHLYFVFGEILKVASLAAFCVIEML